MKLIVIEGADGTGTTHHATALTRALNDLGVPAIMFHHPRHEQDDDDWSRSLHYALSRARVAKNAGDKVVVADRWYQSTSSIALTLPNPVRSRLIDLCHLEGHLLPQPLVTILLDAPDEVLDERIRDGRPLDAWESCRDHALELRQVYRTMIRPECNAVLDTSRPKAEVYAEILQMALCALMA
jgi:thymidylate kinase